MSSPSPSDGDDIPALSSSCASCQPIPRVRAEDLSSQRFQDEFFSLARPVVITGATEDWPARQWTIEGLVQRVGGNEVNIRGRTNEREYQLGRRYTIRKDTFEGYCNDLLKGNARAKSSYLAVASMQQAFPQLLDEVPDPELVYHF